MTIITTFIGEPDLFDASHQLGAILTFILGIVLLAGYIMKRKKSRKGSAKDSINEHYLTAMTLFFCIIITVFLNGFIEILAGILAIILIIRHAKKFD